MKRWIEGLGWILAVGMLLLGCARPAGPAEIRITMSEFKFEPDTIRVKAGQEVRLVLVNVGQRDHELMIGRNVMEMGGNPAGYHKDFFAGLSPQVSGEKIKKEEEEAEAHAGFMVALEPGGRATVVFTVPADRVGEWEMGCFEENGSHYLSGMKGKLIVER